MSDQNKRYSEEEMKIKVEEAIRWFNSTNKDLVSLYGFMQTLHVIHNRTCKPADTLAWITEFQASYPDH